MKFFVDLTLKLLSPKSLRGFIVGLIIGVLAVWFSIIMRYFIEDPEYAKTPIIGQFLGAILVGLYGTWFSTYFSLQKKLFATFLFFFLGLVGFFLVRIVIEKLFNLPPNLLANNLISYSISCGIACALAGGVFEAITQPD